MSTDRETPKGEGKQEGSEAPRVAGGPFGIILPPDRLVLAEARRLMGDVRNVRVEDLATCAAQDPVLVIELLKTANALYFSGGRQPITSVKTAIVRLGSDVVLDILTKVEERFPIPDEDVAHWFEVHRSRCKRTSIIARMLSEVVAKTLADECQVAGLLLFTGELLAVMHLGEQYVRLAEELSRSGILYRLSQDFRFNVETIGPSYLARNGIPQIILSALDRDAASKSPDKAIMKPLVAAAGEMVEAFDSNRWDKLSPGKTIPPKSALRLLQIGEGPYLKLYERASQYLFAARVEDERRKQGLPLNSAPEPVPAEELDLKELLPPPLPHTDIIEDENLELELQNLIASRSQESLDDLFSLKPDTKPKSTPRKQTSESAAPMGPRHDLKLDKAAKVVSSMMDVMETAQSSEELLSRLLAELVDRGPFEKSALIVVSKDRKNAIVVAARGPNIGNGQTIAIDDPLSPLAQCFSKVQSFGKVASKNSPFGSTTYALATIDADHDTPVALYADCGNSGSITFEARRIFRTIVDILNQKLPQLPGGIPVELSERR